MNRRLRMPAPFRRRSTHRRGQALVEFALVIPVFLVLMVALFDLGRAVFAYNTLTNAAREGARIAIVNQYEPSIIARAKQQTAIVELNDPSVSIDFYQTKADGTLEQGSDGKLVKGNLASIFVMGKGEGWADRAPAELKNGNWVYTGFKGDGTPSGADTKPCRACHLPVAQKDFVHRYDEYFQKRGS